MSELKKAYPQLVVGPEGKPVAVLVDIDTWLSILEKLEDDADRALLQASQMILDALRKGDRPAGWLSWEEVEAQLEALEQAGELPD